MIKWCFCVVLALWSTVRAAPLHQGISAEEQRSLDIQQFLVLNPQDFFPQETALKYRQPLVTPLNQLGYISTPKEQFYFYYPSVPFTQQPLISFKQPEEQKFLPPYSFLVNFLPPGAQTYPLYPPPQSPDQQLDDVNLQSENKDEKKEEIKEEKPLQRPAEFEMKKTEKLESFAPNPEAEQIPQNIPPKPAIIPPFNDRRVYVLSGQPQFFGNFDAFSDPLNPLFSLQPLATIHPRSNDRVENNLGAQALAEVAQPVAELKEAELIKEEEPQLEQLIPEEAQLLDPVDLSGRSNSQVEAENENKDKTESKEIIQGKSDNEKKYSYEDPSVSQAQPTGIALALGPGGIASSSPSATAVTGTGGIALASPKATSISGDFLDFDKKTKEN